MMNDLLERIKGLPLQKQRIIFILGNIATLLGYVAALNEWSDGIKPGFIGASLGGFIWNFINYLLGRPIDNVSKGEADDE